jgi:signal transduction histidine kinase
MCVELRPPPAPPDEPATTDAASIGILAHDMRSPLQTIALCCDLLGDRLRSTDPPSAALVGVIRDSVAQMGGIIADVLDPDFAAPPTGVAARTPVGPALQEAVDRHRAMAEVNGVVLETLSAPPAPAVIEKARLLRVLANLLTNAIRFTPPGGRIQVSAETVRDEIWIFVADTGVGIAEDRLATLFDDRAPASPASGGFGLRIVERIVQRAGGSVSAVSSVGHGSTFTVILPRSSARTPPQVGSAGSAGGAAGTAAGTPGRRLSAGSSPRAREVLCMTS